MYIPEDKRPYPTEKNPHCSTGFWRPQEDLLEEDEMRDPNWYPKGTNYNVYNRKDFQRGEEFKVQREHNLW